LIVGNSDDEEVRRGKTQEMLVEMGLRREVGAKGMFALVKCCRDDYVDVKIEVAREEGGECENDGEGELGFTGEAKGCWDGEEMKEKVVVLRELDRAIIYNE
jgi:hypothetical protein